MSEEFSEEELEVMRRRRERIERMREEKQKRVQLQQRLIRAIPIVGLVCIVLAGAFIMKSVALGKHQEETVTKKESMQPGEEGVPDHSVSGNPVSGNSVSESSVSENSVSHHSVPTASAVYTASLSDHTEVPPGEVDSASVLFLDLQTGEILAQRDYKAVVSPASMTKVLTILVAAEHVTNLQDTFTITREITDYSYSNDCSSVGFDVDETVTIQDLFYGTILPSGADAAVALATYVAGSQEAFVDLMNEKVSQLGLSETAHFTNCVGIYDEDLHCTVYDMAMIMEAALDNPVCKEVMSAHTYTTSKTVKHPDGITISNWFLRRIEDKDTGGTVVCAKTGFVVQSRNCAVSYGEDDSGREYICVTAGASSAWRCIYDHVALYKKYAVEKNTPLNEKNS